MATDIPVGATNDMLAQQPRPVREHNRDESQLGGDDNIQSSPLTTSGPTAHIGADPAAAAMGAIN